MAISILCTGVGFLLKEGIRSIVKDVGHFELLDIELPPLTEDYAVISDLKPDVVIIELTVDTKSCHNDLIYKYAGIFNIIVFTHMEDTGVFDELYSYGVKKILSFNCSRNKIVMALNSIEPDSAEPDDTGQHDMRTGITAKTGSPDLLSPRELEVLRLIGNGSSSREISEALFISLHTVNSHRKNLLRKLNMKSPAQLIVYAHENNLC